MGVTTSWKDAPKWARYLAQDANGIWYWYKNEPGRGTSMWHPNGQYEAVYVHDWDTSLQARPTNET